MDSRITRSAILPIILLPLAILAILPNQTTAQTGQNERYFPETNHYVKGLFLKYWNDHGGLAQQGYPLTEEFQEQSPLDGKTYTVQYFERAIFEHHPENAGTHYEVLLSQLGTFEQRARYPDGAPAGTPSPNNPITFSETGHTMGGKFRTYWEKNGGLAQQGFPLTEEFQEVNKLDGKTYTVQYFERAIFELHPELAGTPYEVLLTQLGTYQHETRYPGGSNPAAAPQPSPTPVPATPTPKPPPPTPCPACPYDGEWSGQTAQGKPIAFTVTRNAITFVELAYEVSNGGCTVTGSTSGPPDQVVRLDGNEIHFTRGNRTQQFHGVIGQFNTRTSASGVLNVHLFVQGCGRVEQEDIAWTATKQ